MFRNGVSAFRPRLALPGILRQPPINPSEVTDEAGSQSRPVWKWLYAIAAAAFIIRLAVALWSVRIGHPDEVFQYLEQAHRLVYGYGFRPWEYRFGARNWLLPGTLAALLEFLRLLHVDRPALYIPALKLIFAALSICLVFASYVIGRQLFSERTGRLAGIIAAIWYELVSASIVATPEVLGAYAILCAFAIATTFPSRSRAAWAGLLLGAGVALRPQYALPGFAVWAYLLLVWKSRYAPVLTIMGFVVPILAGVLDAITWGTPFISYVNYFLFGSVFEIGGIFGNEPVLWYVTALSFASLGLYPIAMAHGVVNWRRSWPLLLVAAAVLIPHSLIPHKEYRFIFLAVPLLLLLMADAIATHLRRFQRVAILWACVVSVFGFWQNGLLARDDRLLAAWDLSRRSDVSAVLDLTGRWWDSGGYSYMHKDVPLYFWNDLIPVSKENFHLFASHLIVRGAEPAIPGFRTVSRHHDIAVLEQISPRKSYQALPGNTRDLIQPGVDDRFKPLVYRDF